MKLITNSSKNCQFDLVAKCQHLYLLGVIQLFNLKPFQ